jgi:N-acetylmuramoyl-L-alanine amidase
MSALRCAVLGLLAAALLLPQASTARTTNAVEEHATAGHAPKAPASTHGTRHPKKVTARTNDAAAKHASVKRTRPRPGRAAHIARPGIAKPHGKAVSRTPVPKNLADRPLIVIDPGHGGRDPGAIGVSGTLEKTITLATALELRRSLEATGRYRVALTRTRDSTISLANRLAFARQRDADLLIAIHADASPDRHARGASVYVSSGNTTTRVPANRASSHRIASALSRPEPQPEESSAWLQHSMIEQLSDDVRMVAAPARDARFYVLAARTIPSVLLEMGFLSNRQDETLMKQPAKRRVLVQAIRDAIDDYFSAIEKSASRT